MGATDGADVPGRPSPRPRERFAHPKLRASPKAQRGAQWGVIGRSEAQSHARRAQRAAHTVRWSLDAHGQGTAGKPALAQDTKPRRVPCNPDGQA